MRLEAAKASNSPPIKGDLPVSSFRYEMTDLRAVTCHLPLRLPFALSGSGFGPRNMSDFTIQGVPTRRQHCYSVPTVVDRKHFTSKRSAHVLCPVMNVKIITRSHGGAPIFPFIRP